jgi:hypothetical protein
MQSIADGTTPAIHSGMRIIGSSSYLYIGIAEQYSVIEERPAEI